MKREFGLPNDLVSGLQFLLTQMGWWNRWPELAKAVIELSEHFHKGQAVTPWREARFQAAYLAYFLPLNFARISAVLTEARLQNLPLAKEIVDIGSGPGTASLAWAAESPVEWVHWEMSTLAHDIHRRLLEAIGRPLAPHRWTVTAPPYKDRVVIASYALNEMTLWPNQVLEARTLVLVEPSTQEAARRLMAFRQTLKENGFYLWAPCTHHQGCPLLEKSKTDWCHDRIFFSPPEWWEEFASHLPMRNQTLTFSYLLASREAPIRRAGEARVIGDTLKERGKWRQAVCRNENREFLSWLTRHGEPETIPHGTMVRLPEDIEVKGSELRPHGPVERIWISDT